tara:strand:+ start:380 stop:688 length:309 start_codon:yes stop_codon:yes gene_type:complete
MIIDFTELDYTSARAVSMLMKVYAEHFAGETFHLATNENSGAYYLALDCSNICPFVYGSGGDVFFEVIDFEEGDTCTFGTFEEAEDYSEELAELSSDGREGR